MSKNTSVHDKFIRTILANKSLAVDYFKNYLPEVVSHQLDFSTLEQQPDTYISKELQKTMSDIVYTCQKRDGVKAVKVSLLIEHKSFPDKYTPIQIGGYIFSALQKQVSNKEPLCVVIPVLLYHGKEKWEYRTLAGLFEDTPTEWKQFVPDFSYIYNNFGEILDEAVESLRNRFLTAALLAMKHSFQKKWLENNALRMLVLIEKAPMNLQKSFILYFFDRGNMKEAAIEKLFKSLPVKIKNTVMSTLDIYEEKGRKKGIEEGEKRGEKITEEKKNYEFVKNLLLETDFPVTKIAALANVTEAFVRKVKNALK